MQLTPENRTQALLGFFGWQGGTIHQIAEATGLTAHEILYGDISSDWSTDNAEGWFAARTCSRDWRVARLAPKAKGNQRFWAGAIAGYWAGRAPNP